ncbi:hypothetical protein TNCV_2817121 [Trichonephila clavipes]|nr:hypothetical protein TNCV_2817121 [Trichonephila clavipes]
MGGRMEIKYLPWTNRQKLNLYGSCKFDFHNHREILKSSHVIASGAEDVPCSAFRYHVDKFVTWTVNFLQLNINGTRKKTDELSSILHTHNIHVACLQETKLNSKLNLKVKGYTVIRKDIPTVVLEKTLPFKNSRGEICRDPLPIRGVATAVSAVSMIWGPLDSSTEAQTIIIFLPKHTINAYYPDNSPLNVELLQNLTDTSSETKIILGDLNAKSLSWGRWLLDTKIAQFEDLAADLDQGILNSDEDTYVSKPNGTASALEIFVISCHSTENSY